MTKLNQNQLTIMAAILGVGNIGCDHLFRGSEPTVTPDIVKKIYNTNNQLNIENVVYHFAGCLFESEEMAEIFCDEAKSWIKKLRKMPVKKIKSTWEDTAKFLEAMGLGDTL
jgi:hypothetical protein